ncbi:MAG: hypothetical protein KDC34_06455 [Saprospiraceae bacterium]|nr:hypothetical protein [Saprospiraceae bacterium]
MEWQEEANLQLDLVDVSSPSNDDGAGIIPEAFSCQFGAIFVNCQQLLQITGSINDMFRQIFSLTLIIFGFWLASSCTKQDPSYLKPYYFPLDSLYDGQVYEYRSVGDTLDPPYYWFYRTIEQEGHTYLTGMYYNEFFQPGQLVREEAVESGMLLEDCFLFETDSVGLQHQVPAEVGEASVFPFETSGVGSVYVFSISYSMEADSGAVTSFFRNRQYMGDTSVLFKDKEYHAVQFYVRELVDIEDEGHTEHEFDGLEIYAKGLGLFYSRKNINADFVLEYELFDRYPMTELEAKFQDYMSSPLEEDE